MYDLVLILEGESFANGETVNDWVDDSWEEDEFSIFVLQINDMLSKIDSSSLITFSALNLISQTLGSKKGVNKLFNDP